MKKIPVLACVVLCSFFNVLFALDLINYNRKTKNFLDNDSRLARLNKKNLLLRELKLDAQTQTHIKMKKVSSQITTSKKDVQKQPTIQADAMKQDTQKQEQKHTPELVILTPDAETPIQDQHTTTLIQEQMLVLLPFIDQILGPISKEIPVKKMQFQKIKEEESKKIQAKKIQAKKEPVKKVQVKQIQAKNVSIDEFTQKNISKIF